MVGTLLGVLLLAGSAILSVAHAESEQDAASVFLSSLSPRPDPDDQAAAGPPATLAAIPGSAAAPGAAAPPPAAQPAVAPPAPATPTPDDSPALASASSQAAPAPPATPNGAALEPPRPSFDPLQAKVAALLQQAGATGGVALVELGGREPAAWSLNGDQPFTAASTYKLPLLMEEAQNVAAGRAGAGDAVCFQDSDWEDGWFGDYQDGSCYQRSELDQRVGQNSDNTGAHILVRVDGGGDALNAYAMSHGARESAFWDPNTTTANDLAALLVDESSGRAGGAAAQQYLYPLLTHTAYEQGIPAGVQSGAAVVHKIGILDGEVNDAALVENGPSGSYVLVVCTNGPGGDAGWSLIADISRAVWQYEASR